MKLIKKLQHTNIEIAIEIRSVFQVSYAVEAKLLNANSNTKYIRSYSFLGTHELSKF
jgi:hypothetical protein